jgi:hypothetical protein
VRYAWLPTISANRRRVAVGVAALGATLGLTAIAGPALAAGPAAPGPVSAPADPLTPADLGAAVGSADQAVPVAAVVAAVAPTGRVANYVGALQPNGWYCGPAATRIALSAHGILPTFDTIAYGLGTTRHGTNSILDVTRVLNGYYGDGRYASVQIPERSATTAQVKKLRSDVVSTISAGDVVVANIKGTIFDTAGAMHSYNGGHYVSITGYTDSGGLVTVTDPADRIGSNEYQVPVAVMADWIATKGYAA